MKRHEFPWDNNPDSSEFDFAPLFTDGYEYSLSEAQTFHEYHPFISAGHSLAALHFLGYMHGDLHKQNHLYYPPTGAVGLIDLPDEPQRVTLDPAAVVLDFVPPYLASGPETLQAYLVGYVKTSLIHFEPKIPGFTDALLAHVGGVPKDIPYPQLHSISVAVATLGFEFELDKRTNRFSLNLREPNGWLDAVNQYPDAAGLILIGLILAGLDVRILVDSALGTAMKNDGARELRNLFSNFASGKTLPLTDSHGSSRIPTIAALLKFLQDTLNFPEIRVKHQGIAADGQPNHTIRIAVDEFLGTLPPAEKAKYFDAMIEVINYLAGLADELSDKCLKSKSREYFGYSVRLAQLSQILLQHSLFDASKDEARELAIMAAHLRLSWVNDYLDDSKSDAEVTDRTLTIFTYNNSRVHTYNLLFSESIRMERDGANPGLLWMEAWRALSLVRANLLHLIKLSEIQQRDITTEDRLLEEAISYATAQLGKTVRLYQNELLTKYAFQVMKEWSTYSQELSDELSWAAYYLQLRQTETFGSPEVRESLAAVSGWITRALSHSVRFDRRGLWNAY